MLTPPAAASPTAPESTPDRYYEDLEYLGAPCGYCRQYNCPGANDGGECPESPHYPDTSPDWCNCPDIDNCPVNLAIRADQAPPSRETVRAFHDPLRRAEARENLASSLRTLAKHPGKRWAYRGARWSLNFFLDTYRATRSGVR
ncbi:hypothetical protein [Mycobacteroides abscessus]|uniref:hypothetical protein n=1 Tax=Mycobacteroides abscessus TaxID=36809 RepID=UPI0009A759BB|nr:hypothetical protein [Mycobacteroides abscessus]SKO15410.1 Uncharacterised protein [Mycobacteroides abscessus subsp. bolletii]SKX37350.1 Uncharacterised protein [Mycobacteroides abscessus subsp. bolletii]